MCALLGGSREPDFCSLDLRIQNIPPQYVLFVYAIRVEIKTSQVMINLSFSLLLSLKFAKLVEINFT